MPRFLFEGAIEPRSKTDWEKLGIALAKLAADDPSLRVSIDADFVGVALQGMHRRFHLRLEVRIALNGAASDRVCLQMLAHELI